MIEVAMKKTIWKTGTVGLLIVLASIAEAAVNSESALSPAETQAVSKQIATLKSSTDRDVAHSWSNAKKIAELICRPAALPVLKRQIKGTDRVFLGTDAPQSLTLESDQRLTGSGELRTPQGWQDFSFTCDVNPTTGKVTDFQAAMK
jgi:hypothetical protein